MARAWKPGISRSAWVPRPYGFRQIRCQKRAAPYADKALHDILGVLASEAVKRPPWSSAAGRDALTKNGAALFKKGI
jgi:hypothetical protein